MGRVAPFRSASESAQGRALVGVAEQLISELGDDAGYSVEMFACSLNLQPAARQRLLAIADEIEPQQGFGLYFADEFEASTAGWSAGADPSSARSALLAECASCL